MSQHECSNCLPYCTTTHSLHPPNNPQPSGPFNAGNTRTAPTMLLNARTTMALPQPNSKSQDRESLSHRSVPTFPTDCQATLSTLSLPHIPTHELTPPQLIQYLNDIVAAQPHLLPTIREFVESKETQNKPAKPSPSPRKRKRGGTEDSTYLGTLFDSLAPSPSGRVILRPRKIVDYANNTVACVTRERGMSSRNGSDLENARFSVTESVEKRMELCFGVVPAKSVTSPARPQKRRRLDSNLDDGGGDRDRDCDAEKSENDGLATESKQTGRLELTHETLTCEGVLDASKVDLGDVCPFSLYPNSSCAWGSGCRLKSVCAVRNRRIRIELADVTDVWTPRVNRARSCPVPRSICGGRVGFWSGANGVRWGRIVYMVMIGWSSVWRRTRDVWSICERGDERSWRVRV